jgi:acyl carrier protein
MAAQTGAERAMAEVLIQALNLEGREPGSIDPEAPLFGSHEKGWGLDSIDALEIALALKQKYGVEMKAESEATKKAFASLRTLTDYVTSQRPAH